MKKHLLLTVAALAAFFNSQGAADVIARIHAGATIFHYINHPYTYQTLQDVLDVSQDGDTLYLPGVQFDGGVQDLTLNHRLVLIGTGTFTDSAKAIGDNTTRIWANGPNLRIFGGGSGSQLHGIHFVNSSVYFGTSGANQNVTDVKFYRCHFDAILCLGYNNVNNTTARNILLENCDLQGGINICSVTNTTVHNCAISTSVFGGVASTIIQNNLVVNFNDVGSNTNSEFKDNIFLINSSSQNIALLSASRFSNNLFVTANGNVIQGASTIFTNNLNAPNISNVFATVPANSPLTVFDYHANYHLKAGTSYLTMATNGGQVGLYGGAASAVWKEGLIPFNPHWTQLTVPANTSNGLLNITIGASAQQY